VLVNGLFYQLLQPLRTQPVKSRNRRLVFLFKRGSLALNYLHRKPVAVSGLRLNTAFSEDPAQFVDQNMDVGPVHVLGTYVPDPVKYVCPWNHFPFSLDQKLEQSMSVMAEMDRLFHYPTRLIHLIQTRPVGIKTEVSK